MVVTSDQIYLENLFEMSKISSAGFIDILAILKLHNYIILIWPFFSKFNFPYNFN